MFIDLLWTNPVLKQPGRHSMGIVHATNKTTARSIMVFITNDPKTREAGRKGGKSGKKHLATLSKDKHKAVSSKAGKLSGKKRRELAAARRKQRLLERGRAIEDRIMGDYYL